MIICAFNFAQNNLQILDKSTDFPLSEVEVYDANQKIIDTSNSDGWVEIPTTINEIFIDHPGFPPQFFQLPIKDNKVYLLVDMVNLKTLEINANDEKSLNLIRTVIERQHQNSPKSLENYILKSYTKFWADGDADSIAYIPNPKTKEDSAQNEGKKLLESSMFFLSERAISHYYDKKKGEKNVVEAARISGLQTPLYEVAAMQPISYEFNENEFNFFFRKFPNPLSKAGMKAYNFLITDTIQKNNRSTIEVTFNSKKEEKKSLHGTLLIDQNSFALTNFYAENQTKAGSDTYIEVKYEPTQNVWIPNYQVFKIEVNNMNHFVYEDSIAANGETIQKKIKKKSKSWVNTQTQFSGFQSPATIDDNQFKGYTNEVPKEAFKKFGERIQTFRPDSLSSRENITYVKIDSIGKAEKIDRNIKLFRIISQEGWLSLGNVDLDLKDIYQGNDYEDFRFGVSLRTNYKFHPKLSLNARTFYGTADKKFKYGLGAEYLFLPEKQGKLIIDYSDDIAPSGKFRNPIYTLGEAFRWKGEQTANPNYVDEKVLMLGYQQDFFRKVTARFSLHKATQESLFDYSFENYAADYEFNHTMAQLAIRYAPKEESIVSPVGKFRINRELPVYKLLIDKGISLLDGEQEYTRIGASANFSWSIFNSPSKFNVRMGRVFGDVPIWQYFDGGGKNKDRPRLLQRARFGGTQIFETMIPGEFIVDRFVFGSIQQKLFNLKFGKNIDIPFVGVYKIGVGDMSNQQLHNNLTFNNMKHSYQEVGLEINNLILKVIGVGLYYRVGAYNYNDFERDFSVKAVLNLSSF